MLGIWKQKVEQGADGIEILKRILIAHITENMAKQQKFYPSKYAGSRSAAGNISEYNNS